MNELFDKNYIEPFAGGAGIALELLLEEYVQTLTLDRISLIRPSLLIGERPEQRFLEDIAQQVYHKVSRFIPDSFAYKPVTAEQVAHTMVEAALTQTVKFEIYDNLRIQKMK